MAVTQAPTLLPELAGRSLGTRSAGYDENDAILYALAVGAHASELDLVYEQRLHVLPTLALPLSLWAVWAAGELGVYDPIDTLHVGQSLTVHQPLPRSAELEIEGTIEAVWDKGSAAILDIAVSSSHFDATFRIFVPAGGGFGGERGPSASVEVPARAPELEAEVDTSTEQAALYRLTGDRHPIHIDPAVARAAGFDRPILHGLCTLGSATLALAAAAGRPPWSLGELSARLTAPVYPGSTLCVRGWQQDGRIQFETAVGGNDVLQGRAVFRDA